MAKMTPFTLGCDPELFVLDNRTGKHVSAHTFTPGTKKEPYKVDGGAIQLDGTAIEFNIDPATNAKEFSNNVIKVLGYIKKMLPQGLSLSYTPVVHYDQKYWDSLPDSVKLLGCEPTWNAHLKCWNPIPERPKPTMCTGSGHLHIGWTTDQDVKSPDHLEDCRLVMKQMEPVFNALERDTTSSYARLTERASLYGKNGESRIKSYGVEMRAPSNEWLKFTSKGYEFIFSLMQQNFNSLMQWNGPKHYYSIYPIFNIRNMVQKHGT